MAEKIDIAVPWGWPNATVGGFNKGTMPSDMQLVLATMFEFHPSSNGGSTRAGIYRTDGVILNADATLGVHEGSVVLDTGSNRVVWAPIPHIANVPHDLPTGTAGTITVYVAPPSGGSPQATVGTTTSSTINPSWVVLDRIRLNSGWTRTNQGSRVWDKDYAVLQGTGSGVLSEARDSDTAVRREGNTYRRLQQRFRLRTDADISLALSTTIRSETHFVAGTVIYDVFLDGVFQTSFEREVKPFASTEYWEIPLTVSAGTHSAYVESRAGSITEGYQTLPWRVLTGTSRKYQGDILRVKEEGVSR